MCNFVKRMESLENLNGAELKEKEVELQKEFFEKVKNLPFQQSEDLIDLLLLYGNCNWRLGWEKK